MNLNVYPKFFTGDSVGSFFQFFAFHQAPTWPKPLVLGRLVHTFRQKDSLVLFNNNLDADLRHVRDELRKAIIWDTFVVKFHMEHQI